MSRAELLRDRRVAPSILAADFGRIGPAVAEVRVQSRLVGVHGSPMGRPAALPLLAALARNLEAEQERWFKVIKDNGIKGD